MSNNADKHVVVAMSGGVDSSVAAALLLEQGYNVTGMMMRLWSEETFGGGAHNRCCTPDQMADARRIASKLGIPFYVLDTKEVFRNTIVEFFINQHREGVTPNPCLECNRHIRFHFLLQNALALDADYLATGHYARLTLDSEGGPVLLKGCDPVKDQSYFLHTLDQKELSRIIFPLGNIQKSEVRKIAKELELPVAEKKESQDICFLGGIKIEDFLKKHIR
jgi:tRNA-specific 2-thiouridylase